MKVADTDTVVRAAAAAGLPGVRPHEGGADLLFTTPALNVVTGLRIEGLVRRAITSGLVAAPPPTDIDVEQAWLAAVRRSLEAEWWAYETLVTLDAAGVPALVLKGIAIAHLDHDDPSERVFGDADVLIHRADHGRALAALTAAGFRRVEPPVHAWWERRFSKAVMLRTPSGGELDLHLSITGGYFGERIDHERLWAAPCDTFDLGGRATQSLGLEGRWLHACCHAVLGGGSGLRALRDVAQLLLVRDVDWRAVVRDATSDGVDAVVAAAVRDTWQQLRLDPQHEAAQWAERHAAPPDQRRALAAYRMANVEGWGAEGWSTMRALGRLDRVRFTLGVAWPSTANLRYRGRTRLQHLRALATVLGSITRRRSR